MALGVLVGGQGVAGAVPLGPAFGPFIENLPGYQAQSTCSPDPKPGVLAFEARVLEAYPKTGSFGISRACDVGGTSEHKEGRAWDWKVSATVPGQKAQADEMIKWLLSTDRHDNKHAMARRLGIMYLIWNRRIWAPWSGWSTYCVQRPKGCVSPGTSDVRNPHTDHVHLSFTWDGAMKRDTFWRPAESLVADIAASYSEPSFWSAGGNGFAASSTGAFPYEVKGRGFLKHQVVDIATTSTGAGYWLLLRSGRVSAFGDAGHKGGVNADGFNAVSIAARPSAKGYWVLGAGGRVFPLGDAKFFGDERDEDVRMVSITPSPTGKGYWVLWDTGHVSAFGDAVYLGDAYPPDGSVEGMDVTSTGLGYWLVTEAGRVQAFGDARSFGDLAGQTLKAPIVAIEATPSGRGYWLVSSLGRIFRFGEARDTSARQLLAPRTVEKALIPQAPSFIPGD